MIPTKKQKTGNTDELKKQLLTAVIVLVTNILFTATVYAQPHGVAFGQPKCD